MKKLLILAVQVLLIVVALVGNPSSDFLLGNYSYWQGKDKYPPGYAPDPGNPFENAIAPYALAADSVFKYMVECGYNTTICNSYLYEDSFTGAMLNKMGSSNVGLKAILTDFGWDGLLTNDYYSTRGLSLSNYQRYEAEYRDEADVNAYDGIDDRYYYRSRGDESLRGAIMPDNSGFVSNDYYLECDPNSDQPGYVYDGFVYRWNTNDYNNPTHELKKEFQFVKLPYEAPGSGLTAYMLNNTYVYITVAFRCPDEEGRVDWDYRDLITLDIINPNTGDPDSVRIPFQVDNVDYIDNQATVTDWHYQRMPTVVNGINRLLIAQIPLSTFDSRGMLLTQGGSTYVLSEFNVRVYWHGLSLLNLDYIDVEDSVHKSMRTNMADFSTRVNSRINSLRNLGPDGVIKSFYGFDEPNQPQFDSYRLVQDMIDSDKPNLVSAVYDWQRKMEKLSNSANPDPLERFYQHQLAFIEKAKPKYFAPDIYPIVPQTAWNEVGNQNFIQTLLERNLLCRYNSFKESQSQSGNNYKFYPVVQAFGEWVADNHWESWLRPPPETQKMLQYLPLCYQPDGIINYIFPTFTDGVAGTKGQYGALKIINNGSGLTYEPQSNFYALKEANHKILSYHERISESEWLGADSLKVSVNNTDINLNPSLLSSLFVLPSAGIYQGFIQCGLYVKANQPRFMLVNRRANYLRLGYNPVNTINENLDDCFIVPLAQTVRFVPDANAHTTFGTYVSLYDSYSDTIVVQDNGSIDVVIQPGDGKLLQMCSSLPPLVTSNATLKKTAYLSGVIEIDQGAEVTILPNTVTEILPNSLIRVTGGSTLNLSGRVTIADSVSILVEPGSSINFNRATCTWGVNSYLQVYEALMNASHTSFAFNLLSELPYGITLSNGSVANLADVTISGSNGISVLNSDLYITDIDLYVPANRTGIEISNGTGIHEVHIDNTLSDGGITGIGEFSGRGIHGNPVNGLKLKNLCFSALGMGVELEQSTSIADSITGCSFENCRTGISLTGCRSMPIISACSFVSDDPDIETKGIVSYGAYPKIVDCTFEKLEVGVFAEFTSPTAGRGSISHNTFTQCAKGIESRGSSYRVNNNVFTHNETGINMVTGSNMNIGYNALNSMSNTRKHLAFLFDQDFYASVQLYNGHNNFQHQPAPDITEDALDFAFNDHFQIPVDDERFKIDVSGNWFEDGTVLVDPPSYAQYITYTSLDPYPNLMNSYAVLNRMDNAQLYESQGQNQQAMGLYKAILDEGLISEEQFLAAALDGVYRLSGLINDPAWDETSYLDAKTLQYAGDIPGLSMLIDEYRVKSRIDAGDFQSAINMVEGRISSPRSEVDSLLAVLDLEMVLLLQNNDEAKQAVSTKYGQYKYPSMKAFKAKHEEHWAMLYSLAGKADVELALPKHPRIQTNYPNPFNPSTTIAYSLPAGGEIRLSVYNVKGQMIRELVNEERPQGQHTVVWDGTDKKAGQVCSGIYFVRLESGNKNHIHKMVMMK